MRLLDECADRVDYAAVLIPCLQCLRNLAATPAAAHQLCGADIIRKLSHLLARSGPDPAVASALLAVLANLSLLPDVKGSVAGAVLDKTFLAMRTGRSHASVTREAAHLLRSLSAAQLYQTTVFRNVGLVMAAAETYHNDAGIQESCLAVFRNLATNMELRKALLSASVLEIGFKTMKAHYNHPGIQVKHRVACARPPSCSLLPYSLLPHTSMPAVASSPSRLVLLWQQRFGCGLVRNMVAGSAGLRAGVAATGCCEHVFRAMVSHPRAAEVQTEACTALQCLSADAKLVPLVLGKGMQLVSATR